MNVQDRISAIHDLLNVEKLNDSQRRQLRDHVNEVIIVPEGREFFQKKIDEGRFRNRKPFMLALLRSLTTWREDAADDDPMQLQKIAIAIAKHSTVKERMYWSSLVFLQGTKYSQTGRLLCEQLRRLPSVRKDSRITFSKLDWRHISVKQRASLLEEARRAATERDFQTILDNALVTLQANVPRSQTSTVPTDHAPTTEPRSSLAPTSRTHRPGTEDEIDGRGSVPLPAPSRDIDAKGPGSPTQHVTNLKECLSAVSQTITALFSSEGRKLEDARSEIRGLQQSKIQADEQRRALEYQIGALEQDLAKLRAELQTAHSSISQQRSEIQELRAAIVEERRDAAAANARAEELSQQLAQAKSDAEHEQRRVDDYVRQAHLEREHGLQTFRVKLWNRIRPYLLETLDGGSLTDGLSSDQMMLVQRLQQILDVLREFEVTRE